MTPFDPLALGKPLQAMQEIVHCLGWTLPVMAIVGCIQVWILARCSRHGTDTVSLTLYFSGTLVHLASTFLAAAAAEIRICQILGQVGLTDPARLALSRSEFLLGLYTGAFIAFISAFGGFFYFSMLEMRRRSSACDSTTRETPNQAVEGTAR